MSELPSNWKAVRLKDSGTWLSGGTPSTDEPRYWDGDILWISAASMKDFRINHSNRCITELGALIGTRLVSSGTVLFVVRGMSLKSEFRVGVTERRVAFGQDCKAIIPAPGIDGKFLALALKARSRQVLAMVDEAGHGTGRLPTDLIAKLEIGVPELDEQQRIVEIIDAIDNQIIVEESALSKVERISSGIANDLMAHGIHGSGESWERVLCKAAFSLASGLPYEKAKPSECGKTPIYGSSGLAGHGQLSLSSRPTFVIGRVGEGGVGSVYYLNEPSWVTDNALWAKWIDPAWLPEFIAMYLTWFDLRRFRSQTGQPLVTQAVIAECPLAKPDLQEQREIVEILKGWKSREQRIKQGIAKLRLVKQGVMEDLLTERVRVPGPWWGARQYGR